jgi:hypothetical protein
MSISKFMGSASLAAVLAWSVGGAALGPGCSHVPGYHSGQTWPMSNAKEVPAASGEVRVVSVDSGNATIDVGVKHLARPAEAFPGNQAYIVWLKPDEGGAAQNLGELPVGDDLQGTFRTTTAFKRFQLFITAEQQTDVTSPSGNRVLDTAVSIPG